MNKLFGFSVALIFAGCASSRPIQGEFVNAELIRIDTVYRHPGDLKLLTWRCSNQVEIVTMGRINDSHKIGSTYQVLLAR
jgi:hypothetical protein